MLFSKLYSEMTNQEIRDELAKMLKELRVDYRSRNWNWNDDFVRQYKQSPIKYKNGIDILQFVYNDDNPCITIEAIKDIQSRHNLKDTDSICVTAGEDHDGCIETVLTFVSEVPESDLDYHSRIKDFYLHNMETDKVYEFISAIKKRTGTEMPYYQAKAAMEILEGYKENSK